MKNLFKEVLTAGLAIAFVLNSPAAYASTGAGKYISALEKLDGMDRKTHAEATKVGQGLIEYAKNNPNSVAQEIKAELKVRGYTDSQIARVEALQDQVAATLGNPNIADNVKDATFTQLAKDVSRILAPATGSLSMSCPEAGLFLGGLIGGTVLVIIGVVKNPNNNGLVYAGLGGYAAAVFGFIRIAQGYCG
jgi:hypothetical protein